MLRRLLEIGFTEEEIKSYCKTNHTLDEMIHNTDIQLDDLIKRGLLLELYKLNH